MAWHRYRVTRRFLWMKGGRPGPRSTWLRGTPVVYEPGTTIRLDHRLLPGLAYYLAATDDGGRAALDFVRSALEAPAEVTTVADCSPQDRAWLNRVIDEKLRVQGRSVDLVTRLLERGDEPSRADFLAALSADGPHPQALTDYALEIQRKPRRRGPKHPRRTTWQDLDVTAYYQYELDRARHALAADSRRSRAVADVAKRATATAFGISKRTVERILTVRR